MNLSDNQRMEYSLNDYLQARGICVTNISPKLVSINNKEIVLMHIILQKEKRIWSIDIWPYYHIELNDIYDLPSRINNLTICIIYQVFNDNYGEEQIKQSLPLWTSYYCEDKEFVPSGPEITYDLFQDDYVSQIYNRAYPLMPTYSLTDFLLFIDTETTGLPIDPKTPATTIDNWPRLVQIAWILADKTGNIIDEFSSLIKPEGFTIPENASALHNIYQYDAITKGRQLKIVLHRLNSVACQVNCIIGHNISFDLNVIAAEMIRCNIENYLNSKEQFCTMIESEQFCNLPGSKYPSLNELYQKLFDESLVGAHDAMEDVRATMKCYWEMKKRGIYYIPENLPF